MPLFLKNNRYLHRSVPLSIENIHNYVRDVFSKQIFVTRLEEILCLGLMQLFLREGASVFDGLQELFGKGARSISFGLQDWLKKYYGLLHWSQFEIY